MQDEERSIWPQPGKQEEFLSSEADICIYGGAAGSGKTYGILLEPLHYVQEVKGFGTIIFRRTTPQITAEGALWDTAAGIYPYVGATPNQSDLKWVFPPHNNAIKMAHLEYEKNVFDYQGSQVPLIVFDELTHFTEFQFWYLLSRNRSVCGVRPYIRATCNPDPDSWVAKLVEWWIDQDTGYPYDERSGVLRWFIRVNNLLVWSDTPEELKENYPDAEPKSLTFIPAKLEDNPILMREDPQYRTNLMALNYVEMMRLRYGNWKVRPATGDVFRRSYFDQRYPLQDYVYYQWPLKIQSWDTAFKAPVKRGNKMSDPDFSVCTTWGMNEYGYFMIDRWKDRVSYPQLLSAAEDQYLMHRPHAVLVEDKASGQSLIQSLRASEHLIPVEGILPLSTSDKRTRAESTTPLFRSSLVWMPESMHWLSDYVETMVSFPEPTIHDDDVDSTSMALWYMSVGQFDISANKKTVYRIVDDYAI